MTDYYNVSVALADAKAIAWDTCHKIYVLMDDEQVIKSRGYGYGEEPNSLFTSDQMNPQQMLEVIKNWYEQSCALRFVDAVSTMPEGKDPNEGFETLIGQFDDENEECEDCGERGCQGVCNDNCDECGYPGNCECDDEDEEDEY